MTSAANTGNAIERLTEAVTEQVFGSESRSEVLAALAAVDALYQAAKYVANYPLNLTPDAAYAALAAAVRRIDGEA